MSTAPTSPTFALPVARAELRFAALESGHQRLWTVKDPVALRYYQLRDEEHFILRLLDGRHTAEQIIELFERRFAPRRLRRGELTGFVLLLHREGLVVPSTLGQDQPLLDRRRRTRSEQLVNRITNVLAIQLGGINPNRWLSRVVPSLGWLFSPASFVFAALMVGAAAAVVAVHFATLVERLPRFHEFFGPANVIWLAVSLAAVKTLHELGHAVTCKRLGGDCNRMGLMLLVFTPALYCQVTDAWMFRRKWHRIAVSAAGMVVELVLAAAATLLWASTQPGLLNSLCLNVMFICSVGTLMINGNPLLRYDGYYILADLVGVPNLRQQASSALDRLLAGWLAGVRLERPPGLLVRQEGWLLAYAIASLAYRIVVVVGLLWFVHAALKPHGLAVVAQLIAALTVVSLVMGPLIKTGRFLSDPGKRSRVKSRRLIVSLVGLLLIATALVAIPFPCRVTAPVVLRPRDARRVYATTGGVLEFALPEGTRVVEGQELARLRNRALELEVATLAARHDQQRLHIQHLKLRQHDIATLADELPAAQKMLADLDQQLAQKRRDLGRLSLTAPRAGTLLPPRRRPEANNELELPGYSGTPLETINLGCFVEAGTLFGMVGDPTKLEAVALVDESAVPLLGAGQSARLQLAETPGRILDARVLEVAQAHEEDIPPELLETGSVPLTRGPDGRPKPTTAVYQVVVALDADGQSLLVNGSGWTRITVAPQSLAVRAYRALRSTIRLPW